MSWLDDHLREDRRDDARLRVFAPPFPSGAFEFAPHPPERRQADAAHVSLLKTCVRACVRAAGRRSPVAGSGERERNLQRAAISVSCRMPRAACPRDMRGAPGIHDDRERDTFQ
ncbi:hypothetical protein GQ56_0126190 [Burkholderia paludis]|nr:hypothetical protein GQ56_0126190 [Burkholderia paludis]